MQAMETKKTSAWTYDDGGRSKHFKGKNTVADCVTRAAAIATGKDYKEVYETIRRTIGYTPRNGVKHGDDRKAMRALGATWHPVMGIGTGCTMHLRREELPKGRIVCLCSGHYTAVIDGTIHDTFDPTRGGTRCVYGYYTFDDEDSGETG